LIPIPDPKTTGIMVAGGYVGKEVLTRVIGPSLDYIGQELRLFTERRFESLRRIAEKADEKLGARRDEAGTVPPRLLSSLLLEGSYAEDTVAVDYYAGVLAASRTPDGKDDRGLRAASMIARLSSFQLRAHYLIYSTIHHELHGKGLGLHTGDDRQRARVWMPIEAFAEAMNVHEETLDQATAILEHAVSGLCTDDLITEQWGLGHAADLRKFGYRGEAIRRNRPANAARGRTLHVRDGPHARCGGSSARTRTYVPDRRSSAASRRRRVSLPACWPRDRRQQLTAPTWNGSGP